MRDIETLFGDIRAKGYRITVVRSAILKTLFQEEKPLSATDLRSFLEKQNISADKVTVYRELEFLESEGVVIPVQFQDRNRRYELASTEHHHHLVCQKCNKIEDIDLKDDFQEQEKLIAKKMNFTVLRHSLEFFGLCAKCR